MAVLQNKNKALQQETIEKEARIRDMNVQNADMFKALFDKVKATDIFNDAMAQL